MPTRLPSPFQFGHPAFGQEATIANGGSAPVVEEIPQPEWLLSPGEWAAGAMVLIGSGMMVGSELFQWNQRWNRWGGILLTISGAATAWVSLRRHNAALRAAQR